MLSCMVIAAYLVVTALSQNVTFFYSPSELLTAAPELRAHDRPYRIGGMVVENSIRHDGDIVYFTVTDYSTETAVRYQGIPPDLFAENQGVIARGRLADDSDTFIATQILAKHDENYMPPEVAKSLKDKTDYTPPSATQGYNE